MPKAILQTIGNLIEIAKDGSQKKVELNLHVSEYVADVHTSFLFRYCLY